MGQHVKVAAEAERQTIDQTGREATPNGPDPTPAPTGESASSPEGHRRHDHSKPWRVEGMPELTTRART